MVVGDLTLLVFFFFILQPDRRRAVRRPRPRILMTESQTAAGSPPRRGPGRTTTGLAAPSIDVTNERRTASGATPEDAEAQPLFWIGAVFGLFFTLIAIAPQWFARGADRVRATCPTPSHAIVRALVRLRPAGLRLPGQRVYARAQPDHRRHGCSGGPPLGVVVGAIAGLLGGFTDASRPDRGHSTACRCTSARWCCCVSALDRHPDHQQPGPGAVRARVASSLDGPPCAGPLEGHRGEGDYRLRGGPRGPWRVSPRILIRHISRTRRAGAGLRDHHHRGADRRQATLTYLGVGLQRPAILGAAESKPARTCCAPRRTGLFPA